MRSHKIAVILWIWSFPAYAVSNELLNASFEAAPILGDGQSDVGQGGTKWTTITPDGPGYTDSVSGIPDWRYGFDGGDAGVHTDIGPSRQGALTGERELFSNRWDRYVHQTTSEIVSVGDVFDAKLAVLDQGGLKAGRLQLIAGAIDADNALTPGSVVLAEVTFGSSDWAGGVPDMELIQNEWTVVSVSHTFDGTIGLGLPLTFAFKIDGGSAGPLRFDDASLTRVPEPNALLLGLIGTAACARRRRSRAEPAPD